MIPLTDTYSRQHTYLRIAVTERCNLRCRYCMPPEGIELWRRENILTFDEIVRLATIFASMGVRKIRLTGGEPLVRRNLPELVQQISSIDGIDTVGLTTNGVYLAQFAQPLWDAGLSKLNVSLDTLRPDRFERITLRDHLSDVLAGIERALDAGFRPLKLNVVVMRGVNDDELLDFVLLAQERPLNVRFIEYMPFRSNGWTEAGFISYNEMLTRIHASHTVLPMPASDTSGVAKDFHIPGFQGTVSFITSMSEHFCDACNRLRLTADGSIKPCLFSPAETNLREALRNGADDESIATMIRDALAPKPWQHAPMEELANGSNRTMIQIGG